MNFIMVILIPLICILTIYNNETSFIEMYKIIENDNYIYKIFLEQLNSWWGKNINSKILKTIIDIYI